MNRTPYSRRRFLQTSWIIAAIPASLSLWVPRSATAQNQREPKAFDDAEKIAGMLKRKDPLVWVFAGDSITQGAKHTHGMRSYPEVFGERVRWEMGRSRDLIINSAVSGNTTRNVLDDFSWRVSQFKPAVVSLMIGTNDASVAKNITPQMFRTNLESLLSKIRDVGAVPVLHTPNPIIGDKAPERAALHLYVDEMQQIAEKNKVVLVDHWGHWNTALKEKKVNVHADWLNDALHPNGIGHLEMARLMFKALSIFDPEASTCNGTYYEGEH